MRELFGAIEAGGTKFVCAVGRATGEIVESVRVPTTTPAETLGKAIAALDGLQSRHGRLRAIGVASFGPVECDRRSQKWGQIVHTPKPGWSNTDVVTPLSAAFSCRVGFDTDVNGAALGEYLWGAARGMEVAAYVTVGTGIGGGVLIKGESLHGARHPEIGHIVPPRHPRDEAFAGVCPFHGRCVEGVASGPAILARWGEPLSELPRDHEAHEIVAWYLGHLAASLIATVSPQRLIFGGGVMQTPGLLQRVRQAACRIDAGYALSLPDCDERIVPPATGERAGILGAIALARRACDNAR